MNRCVRNGNWRKYMLFATILGVMILSITTAYAASSGTCGDGVNWSLDDNGLLVISSSGEMYNY